MKPTVYTKPKQYRFDVKVTKADIRNGISCMTSCPVALATNRATRNKFSASVNDEEIEMMTTNKFDRRFVTTYIPQKIQRFVERFDDGKPVKPISFVLRFTV